MGIALEKKSDRMHRIVKYKFETEFVSSGRGEKYGDERVCMSICFSKATCPNFTKILVFTRYLWPWFGPSLTTMQYVMYFRFCRCCVYLSLPAMNALVRRVHCGGITHCSFHSACGGREVTGPKSAIPDCTVYDFEQSS